jgi:hypothetical protein
MDAKRKDEFMRPESFLITPSWDKVRKRIARPR